MTIVECIFNGVIIRCACGSEYHVTFEELHAFRCDCGQKSFYRQKKTHNLAKAERVHS